MITIIDDNDQVQFVTNKTDNVEDTCKEIFKKLKTKNKKIAIVESCTAGNVSAILVKNTPGISNFFFGGLIVYTEEAKCKFLNLPKDTFKICGTESIECSKICSKKFYEIYNYHTFTIVGHLSTNINTIYLSSYDGSFNEKIIELNQNDRPSRMIEAVEKTLEFIAANV